MSRSQAWIQCRAVGRQAHGPGDDDAERDKCESSLSRHRPLFAAGMGSRRGAHRRPRGGTRGVGSGGDARVRGGGRVLRLPVEGEKEVRFAAFPAGSRVGPAEFRSQEEGPKKGTVINEPRAPGKSRSRAGSGRERTPAERARAGWIGRPGPGGPGSPGSSHRGNATLRVRPGRRRPPPPRRLPGRVGRITDPEIGGWCMNPPDTAPRPSPRRIASDRSRAGPVCGSGHVRSTHPPRAGVRIARYGRVRREGFARQPLERRNNPAGCGP